MNTGGLSSYYEIGLLMDGVTAESTNRPQTMNKPLDIKPIEERHKIEQTRKGRREACVSGFAYARANGHRGALLDEVKRLRDEVKHLKLMCGPCLPIRFSTGV